MKNNIINIRLARIKREGSPVYSYQLPVTASNISVAIYVSTQFPLSRKYQPLDSLEIVNNEPANNILVTINNQDAYYCPAGTIRSVQGAGVALWQVAIQNLGAGNTTLGLVRLNLKKEAMTIDKWAANH
ncbi:hypothetical protein CMI37_38875 [Candidatus Pacearchaeota archaeon]|nr:hypothetical protein [Candidatus Pacearchaeota archaeon]|tara:strand:- start:1994 stop:2380 length:387 start_codon:yes stop_codon:yes gene_type:complete